MTAATAVHIPSVAVAYSRHSPGYNHNASPLTYQPASEFQYLPRRSSRQTDF